MANRFLVLALFLMMLSFFFIMDEVSSTFLNKTQKVELAPIIEETAIQDIHTEDSLRQLQGLLGAHVDNFQVMKNKLGTVMQISVPYEDFYVALKGEIKKENTIDFLPTMISLLRSEESVVSYKVDFVLNMPADPTYVRDESPQTYSDYFQRAADIAASLEQAGMPQKLMSAGIAKGKVNTLDITFSRYEGYDPLKGINIDKISTRKALDLNDLKSIVNEVVKAEKLKNVNIIQRGEALIISLPSDVLFAKGSADIQKESQNILRSLSGALGNIHNRIEVVGHSDPRPLEGSKDGKFNTNWALSLARAGSVAAELRLAGYERPMIVRGLASAQFDELSKGMPLEERYERARRVDILIMGPDPKSEILKQAPKTQGNQ